MDIITVRRIIFLLVFVTLAAGTLLQNKIKPKKIVTTPVKNIYNYIETLQKEDVILMSLNYSPGSDAELTPMTKALARHLFKKDIKFVFFTADIRGKTLVSSTVDEIAKEFGKERNKDYVSLGYLPQFVNTIIVMGNNFKQVTPKSEDGYPLDQVEFLKNIKVLADFKLIIDITPSATIDTWIIYGVGIYKIKLAGGCTGVIGTDYYPYIQTGQMIGVIAGLTGAYQYEGLVGKNDLATKRMIPQIFVHILIIVFIIVGNLQYLLRK
ncbi:MAG: hypothetical protein ACK4NF_01640 [Planctomycetota bacterium]